MRSWTTSAETRLLCWRRVREFAVPPSMIEKATARRKAGDWAGACAAARFDVDFDPLPEVLEDLRHLAPDLLRWHMPRVAPDGLLRPGVTVALARYPGGLQLVARTPPGWAEGGQRISLALARRSDRRYRLDLHRHLWDARRSAELRSRPGMAVRSDIDRWSAEAEILLRAEGRGQRRVRVRAGARHLLLDVDAGTVTEGAAPGVPVLPYAATWVPPDVELLRAGLIDPGRLHPLVAAVERLLGPGAQLREGPLRDELTAALERRIDHGLFRAGLAGHCPLGRRRVIVRGHPRHCFPR